MNEIENVREDFNEMPDQDRAFTQLVDAIPGGIVSYRLEEGRFIPVFFSDGIPSLTGHMREEYEEAAANDGFGFIYELDRARVLSAANAALRRGEVLDTSCRMCHKDGFLIRVRLNGMRMGPPSEKMQFYAIFTSISAESRMFQSIADESTDGIYVIDKSNFDLLYAGESRNFLTGGRDRTGEKCYTALHGRSVPCEFCAMKQKEINRKECQTVTEADGHFLNIRFRDTVWNGIPAYVNTIRDITKEVETRREKERLEQYFSTVLKHLPGGVAVVCHKNDGRMIPEFLSEGFASLTGMNLDEAWKLYERDAMGGVYPQDCDYVKERMTECIAEGGRQSEIIYRLKKGDGGYIWVKNSFSVIRMEKGESRVYCIFRDMTAELEEQEKLRNQYRDLIMQHYRAQDPNALVVGHCNVTRNRILEISDHTDSDLLETFGYVREEFFTGLGSLIQDAAERESFYARFLNAPALQAYNRGDLEQQAEYYVKFPKEKNGRYVHVLMNLVSTPDTGDVTGILTVTDVTEKIISDRILHRLSVAGYDFVLDVDLLHDRYRILAHNEKADCLPPDEGCYSEMAAYAAGSKVIAKDREKYLSALEPELMKSRLDREGGYTLSYSVESGHGDIRTKSTSVSAVDMRLGRVCVARTDITDSVREQQGLLRLIAYTFELAGFINLTKRGFSLYTRETVLENLPPYYMENYDELIRRFTANYTAAQNRREVRSGLGIDDILENLEKNPAGYDLLFVSINGTEERYKQINVMWGDANRTTVCLVRADVTDMLAAERRTKKELEAALTLAEEANMAKSDFLSAMSHDIRTPMNAIMGMTTLAVANLEDRNRVADCLEKISVSSRHLLSLINDILDMSKIERSQIKLNHIKIYLPDLLRQLSDIITPQAEAAGLTFTMRVMEIEHEFYYGDALRISQVLLNILSNAVKYTPEGGNVEFLTEEIPPLGRAGHVRYRFRITDTGVGMTEDFLKHIFDPFTRSRSVQYVEGTGLGLSITKGLVDLMGGKIDVISRQLKGSAFTVELEFENALRDDKSIECLDGTDQSASEKKDIFANRFFLIAEDNAINAEILCEFLAMRGAKALVKTDGRQAVEAFEQARPGCFDAVLMDIRMPEMNGYEAARMIRASKHPDASDIPVIAMTANAFAEDVEEAMNAGMNAHVSKPVDMEVLRQALVKVLRE